MASRSFIGKRGLRQNAFLKKHAKSPSAQVVLVETAIATENLGVLFHQRRRYTDALEAYHSAVHWLKKLGNRGLLTRAAVNLGELYLALGAGPEARSLCNMAGSLRGESIASHRRAEVVLLEARLELFDEETEKARALLEYTAALLGDSDRATAFRAQCAFIEADLIDGKVDPAAARLETVVPKTTVEKAKHAILALEIDRAYGLFDLEKISQAIALADASTDAELQLQSRLLEVASFLNAHNLDSAATKFMTLLELERELERCVPQNLRARFSQRPLRARILKTESRINELFHRSRTPQRPHFVAPTFAGGPHARNQLRYRRLIRHHQSVDHPDRKSSPQPCYRFDSR